jgi:hypothetical protein
MVMANIAMNQQIPNPIALRSSPSGAAVRGAQNQRISETMAAHVAPRSKYSPTLCSTVAGSTVRR